MQDKNRQNDDLDAKKSSKVEEPQATYLQSDAKRITFFSSFEEEEHQI